MLRAIIGDGPLRMSSLTGVIRSAVRTDPLLPPFFFNSVGNERGAAPPAFLRCYFRHRLDRSAACVEKRSGGSCCHSGLHLLSESLLEESATTPTTYSYKWYELGAVGALLLAAAGAAAILLVMLLPAAA